MVKDKLCIAIKYLEIPCLTKNQYLEYIMISEDSITKIKMPDQKLIKDTRMLFAKGDVQRTMNTQKDVHTIAARETHIKTTKRCHCTPIRMTTLNRMTRQKSGKDVEKLNGSKYCWQEEEMVEL